MENPKRVFIVDDYASIAVVAKTLLENAGHEATIFTSSTEALSEILSQKPDCVLLDIMMPGMDGLELCRQIRKVLSPSELKIIICSSKSFDYDRVQAQEAGADGYIQKPIEHETFIDQINAVTSDDVTVRFWGARGTLPRPGRDTNKYGGNTMCVTMSFPQGQFFIFDAGSGLKYLGDDLLAQGRKRITGRLFISHPHWDHISTIPFFAPLYVPGNEFQIIGVAQGGTSISDQVKAQMGGIYFPITIREFGAHVHFLDLHEGTYEVDRIEVQTMLLSHPGNCLGYRVNYGGRSICYVTDNELFFADSEFYSEEYENRLTAFVDGADVLITDATYLDEEYPGKVGWGHSCVSQVVELALGAQVKSLYLVHHDPSQNDDAIGRKVDFARDLISERGSSLSCMAPLEGQSVVV